MQYEILDKINSPADLKILKTDALIKLASEIRHYITHSVSQTGGHLASNLGVVELTIAMHCCFDFANDKLFWDVGHQCYVHKILTSRKELFKKLRQKDGLSGFPSPQESKYDQFAVGHAGTAIPTALGAALASKQLKSNEKIVAFVGDASIVNGASFEALNNLGLAKRQMLIILNDNSMAIDVTQGAVAQFLSKVRLSHKYEDLRKTTSRILEHLPVFGKKMDNALENFKRTLRMAITPSRLFESLNIPYFGPVDGHDIASLINLFKAMEHLDRPAILHVYTKKGKGYTPAGDDPARYHSTGPFEINAQDTEELPQEKPNKKTFTQCFSDALVELAEKDEKITAITAAMADGTGLTEFKNKFKDRYYDIGIAESVAVDIAAGQAKLGLKPFVCIYSTFLQRGYDQIFQEAALQNLPVVFCIDRAGVVGSDGPTHHGLMDIGFTRMLPNMILIAPANAAEMAGCLKFAAQSTSPVAIRYPKDSVDSELENEPAFTLPFELGKSIFVRNGRDKIALAAYGATVIEAVKAADCLKKDNIDITVINCRFAKPLDKKIISLLDDNFSIITLEDHSISCGFGSALLEQAACEGKNTGRIKLLGFGNEFIKADTRKQQLRYGNLTADKIIEQVKKLSKNED